jgi:S-formylglutathione hydrolase
MTMQRVENRRCAGGWQKVFTHDSVQTGTPMRFALFEPDGPVRGVLVFLSGLTCSEQNVITKGHFQAAASEADVVVLCPDTSPRGEDVPDDPAYDLGIGAGFYLDATQPPWATHFSMRSYLLDELLPLVTSMHPGPVGITGHSMGGHGALVLGLLHPDRFASVSALAPIGSAPSCPWGAKALTAYLGPDRTAWAPHDAAGLLARGYDRPILVDQGDADDFLVEQLKPELLTAAAQEAGVNLTLRMQPGYDHSYYFVSSFLPEHVRWHAAQWGADRA